MGIDKNPSHTSISDLVRLAKAKWLILTALHGPKAHPKRNLAMWKLAVDQIGVPFRVAWRLLEHDVCPALRKDPCCKRVFCIDWLSARLQATRQCLKALVLEFLRQAWGWMGLAIAFAIALRA